MNHSFKDDFLNALDIVNYFGLDFEDSLHFAVAKRKNIEEII